MFDKKKKKKTKKRKAAIPRSVTDSIPYINVFDNGIIEIEPGLYSKSYDLGAANFKTASGEDQENHTKKYGIFLSGFERDTTVEVTLYNRTMDMDQFKDEVLLGMQADEFNEYRDEFNEMLLSKMTGARNNLICEKILSISTPAEDIRSAIEKFENIDAIVSSSLSPITKEDIQPMTTIERLELLNNIYNQGGAGPVCRTMNIGGRQMEAFSLENCYRQGITTKEVIAPPSMEFKAKECYIGDAIVRSYYIAAYPKRVRASVLSDFSGVSGNILVSAYFNTIPQDEGLKIVKNANTNIASVIVERTKKNPFLGERALGTTIIEAKEAAEELQEEITKENERLFTTNVIITIFAQTEEEMKRHHDQMMLIANQNILTLKPLNYQQEYALDSALPLANNKLSIERLMTTQSVSALMPYDVMDINQKGGFYYGINPISRSMILYNRQSFANPNGCILGMPGSGKSFKAKEEMINVILNTDDEIYIIDPEREYTPLARALGGTVVRLANGSNVHINPFDLNILNVDEEGGDPVKTKANFIETICEIAIGGKYGLAPIEKTLISRCTMMIYDEYLKHLEKTGMVMDVERAPTMKDYYNMLLMQTEREATDLALALERFVNGSYDIFSYRTNVNITNRFTIYDVKDIGSGLKELGLQIAFDNMWNKMIANKEHGKRTWIYIDEFHFLMNKETSAEYISQIWKRARKWNGVPTAITQNVEDMLKSSDARAVINNSPFLILLAQSAMNKKQLSDLLNISPAEQDYISASKPGRGLIRIGENNIPMDDSFPKSTKLYRAMTTRADETVAGDKANN